MLRFSIGTLSSLIAFSAAYFLEGGGFYYFLLPSPLIIVLLVPFFAVLAVWSLKELVGAWKAAFAKGLSEAEGKAAAALWDFYEKAFYAAGVIGTLAGVIVIFRFDVIELKAFSVLFVCLTESIFLGLFARILRARVEKNARAD